MYTPPKSCPRCGGKGNMQEICNIFTTGIPLAGGTRVSLLAVRGVFRPRFLVKYRCGKCGFTGKYDDQKAAWK